ncbi:MAG: 3-dehydroquinate synthase [Myxococcota bacterium]
MNLLDLSFKAGKSRICLSTDFSNLPEQIHLLGFNRRAIVIADKSVAAFHQPHLAQVLSFMSLDWIYLSKGEEGKNQQGYLELIQKVDSLNPTRNTLIIALGGGVTGDMAGFVAATMLRGLPWIQLPTSLLAMVDASVGGKVGVNTENGKNRLGAFYQPPLVYMATDTLQTLPLPELRSGIGEMIKHCLIADQKGFELFEQNSHTIVNAKSEHLIELIERSIKVKAHIVQSDEQERNLRALLNFGHTVGHAIEKVTGFGQLRHGECVGLGVLAELFFTCQEFSTPLDIFNKTAKLLVELGLPTAVQVQSISHLVDASHYDKKIDHGMINLTHVTSIGHAHLFQFPIQKLSSLFSYFSEPS